jgi:FkbM family methyltransferase
MNIKNIVKKITPAPIWNFLRHYKAIIFDRLSNFGHSVCSIKYCGFDLFYLPGDLLVKKIRNNKIFEQKMCDKIEKELHSSNSNTFMDIGSNIGLISLYVSSKIKNISIYAFEPGPNQSKMFEKTILKNNLNSISLYKIALGNEDKSVTFVSHYSPDSSGDGLVDTGRAGQPIPVSVPMMRLDTWWKKNNEPQIDVMKIDTEGSELLILQGAMVMIQSTKPIIYIEIEPKNIKVYPYTRDDLFLWFQYNNYSLYTLDNELCTHTNFASFIGKYDTYIARPKL